MKNAIGIFLLLFLFCTLNVKAQLDNSSFSDNLSSIDSYLTESENIKVRVNLSVCLGRHFEYLIFSKQNDTVYIQGTVHADDEENIVLEKIPYLTMENDSLNFENLFLKRLGKDIEERESSSFVYEIVDAKNDTLRLFSSDLVDRIGISIYHFKIMNRLYPNEEIYIPLEIPVEIVEDSIPEFKLDIK